MRFYTLDGRRLVQCKDFEEWALKIPLDPDKRIVAQDIFPDEVCVSTIFLGIASNIAGPPQVFETMIFGGLHDHYQERYCTWEEAEHGHQRAMYLVTQHQHRTQ